MNDDILIINNKRYVHTPEVKKRPRLEGYTNRGLFRYFKKGEIIEISNSEYDTRMIEIREGEIVVSEDDVRKAFDRYILGVPKDIVINYLFKKYGV